MSCPATLRAGRLRLELLPEIGGSIGRFLHLGDDGPASILRGSADASSALDTACFPLVPFCNRIRGGRFSFRGTSVRMTPNMAGDPNPLHGQGWLNAWKFCERTERDATLVFVQDGGEWPWRYRAKQQFELDDRGLTVELCCTNEADEPMPCGLGFHPYFHCSPETRLATRVETVWTVDKDVLPVATIAAHGVYDLSGGPICGRGLDNGYGGWNGEAWIERPGAPIRIRLSSPDATFFQLYSPRGGGMFVAEPVSHANAALNAAEGEWGSLGMRILEAGEMMTLTMRLDIEQI